MAISVAILVYPDVDVLDITGPLGILSMSTLRNAFSFTIIADTELTPTCSHMRIPRDMSVDYAHTVLSTFDVLLVPGGSWSSISGIAQDPTTPEISLHQSIYRLTSKETAAKDAVLGMLWRNDASYGGCVGG